MSQTIQIKRSASSNVPSSTLAEGELAYGHEGTDAGKLVIGRPLDSGENASNDVIGGKFFVDTVNNATNNNTSNQIVKRNGSGNFSAGTITAALNGNASTATKLAATKTIHGVAFDGSANIDLSEQIQDTVGAMFSSNTESGISVTYQDGDGTIDLAVGTLNQNTTGNAATATALASSRTIQGVSFDGSADISLTEAIQDVVGGMVAGNTENGISVTYQDNDGTLDFAVAGNLNQNTSGSAGSLATGITLNGTTLNAGSNLTLDADDIDEVAISPTNKYFTNARADARVQTLLNHGNHSNITASVDAGTGEVRLSAASQYGNSDARSAVSLHSDSTSNLGSSLAYNNSTGKFTYIAPTTASVRSAVITATGTSGGTGYGSVGYDSSTGALDFAKVTQANIKSSVETTGLTDLTLANASTASNLTFTGVADSSTRTYTFEGGGNSKQLSLKADPNNTNVDGNVFTALDFNAIGDTGYVGTNTIGIGTAAPTSVDQYNYRCEVGPNTKFLGDVSVPGTIRGISTLQLNGTASSADNSIVFAEGLIGKFKIKHNHSTSILSIDDGSTPVISIPNSGNTNPNVTISRNTDFTGNVSVGGTLTVTGGTTTISSTTLAVGDNVITLNTDQTTDAAATEDCGIEVKRGLVTGSDDARALAQLVFDESALEWVTIEPNANDTVTANAASPILTVANINSKTFTIDGGSF